MPQIKQFTKLVEEVEPNQFMSKGYKCQNCGAIIIHLNLLSSHVCEKVE